MPEKGAMPRELAQAQLALMAQKMTLVSYLEQKFLH